MPFTFHRSFRVRYYECDAFGHLNNTNYLRYMQEAAFDASAAAGYDLDRYQEMERMWLVRFTEVEYLRPVYYNQVVDVKTWVCDFRRATSRRMYELSLQNCGEMVARGFTDWVFVDTQTRAPARIADEIVSAFFPEGVPEEFPARQPAPPLQLPPPGAFRVRQQVAWQDIDSAQHVNNPVYLTYAEEAGFSVVAAFMWPVQRMFEEGVAILLRKNQIHYLQPAVMGDELEVSTWVTDVRRSTAVRHYAIHRLGDGALLAYIRALGVWVDLATGKPVRIPAGMLADFGPNIFAMES